MGQGGILAPFCMIGIQERHTFCGTITEFYFVPVEFEIVTSVTPLMIPGVNTLS